MNTMTGNEKMARTGARISGKAVAYWIVTIIFAFSIALSGIGQLMQLGGNIDLLTNIGFPLYVANILGAWKLLGVIAIIIPGLPRVKEWAYSGFFFLMTGAALSHAFANDYGDYGFHIILPLFYAALGLVSWALRPSSRRL